MAKNVERILKFVQEKGYTDVQYLFENTAGQGSELGTSIEELGVLSKQYLKDLPVKFCIDTAHCR
jgi:endonuclease IV